MDAIALFLLTWINNASVSIVNPMSPEQRRTHRNPNGSRTTYSSHKPAAASACDGCSAPGAKEPVGRTGAPPFV
jgi:hypothetical protein